MLDNTALSVSAQFVRLGFRGRGVDDLVVECTHNVKFVARLFVLLDAVIIDTIQRVMMMMLQI